VGNLGAYYTREIGDLEREQRVTLLKPDPSLPLHIIFDLGGTDSTAGWIFQVVGKYVHLLHLLHDTGKGFRYYLEEAEKYRRSVGTAWGHIWAPFDVDQKTQGWEHAESRLMQARAFGWVIQVVPKVNFDDGIEAVRLLFPRLRIDKNNPSTVFGLRALREYQREYDEARKCFSVKPLRNWATHIADATRYLAIIYKRLFDIQMPPNKYGSSY
jgi:hypothetical protein